MHRKMDPHPRIEAWPRRESPSQPWSQILGGIHNLILSTAFILTILVGGSTIVYWPEPKILEAMQAKPALTDPFEPKVPTAPAVVAQTATATPEQGQVWLPRQTEGDPFEPKQADAVTILAVKQGWVRFSRALPPGSDERQPIVQFIKNYQLSK